MKKLLLLLPLTIFVVLNVDASPKKRHHFFHRHKHKVRLSKKKDILSAADIVNFDPA